ncbi:MAG: hypothetical protein V3U51_03390 [Thermoplasmata archaeon]
MRTEPSGITDKGLAGFVVFLGVIYLDTVGIVLFDIFFLGDIKLDLLGLAIYSIVILAGISHIVWGAKRLLASRREKES